MSEKKCVDIIYIVYKIMEEGKCMVIYATAGKN